MRIVLDVVRTPYYTGIMKTITVHTTWKRTQQVEVPDDFDPYNPDDDSWMDQVDPSGAYLADWDLR